MDKSNILFAIATYREAENIVNLVKEIRKIYPTTKVLVINDKSDDKTSNILNEINDKNLIYLERPKKMGLGTAHKLSMFYAIKNNFDYLLTLDADFSHDPVHIPDLIKHVGKNNFVIGSRFCDGAKSDYRGLRKVISILGNFFARKFLNIQLNEITTYFRLYSVSLLKRLPFNELNAQGYSLGVKLVWFMKKLNANLIEIPIHFKDRNKGKSKIPKFQIFVSFFDLILIKAKNFLQKQKFYENNLTYNFKIICNQCNNNYFTLKKKIFVCLVCNNKQK